MTIATTTTKSGPYNGNDVLTTFAYDFFILDEDHLEVTLTDALGVETVLTITTHYTVTGVDNPLGGDVEMLTAPATGEKLTIRRTMPYTQTVLDLVSQGGFDSEAIEDAIDYVVMHLQQQNEEIARAIILEVSDDSQTPDELRDSLLAAEINAAASAAAASASAAASLASEVAAAASLDAFDDIYLGAKAADPTLDNDGDALTTGDLYFNTTTNQLMSYNGAAWQVAAAASVDGIVTTADAVAITINSDETVDFTSDISLPDGAYALLGNLGDLQILHDGVNSYVINDTGTLYLRANTASLPVHVESRDSGGVQRDGIIVGGSTPFVRLHYNGDERLRTTANGITVFQSPSTESANIEIGAGRTGDGASHLDLVGDATYTDYGLRLVRNGGVNAVSSLIHRGTGILNIETDEAAAITFGTNSAERMRILSGGNVGLNTTLPDTLLHVHKGSAGTVASLANAVATLENSTDTVLQLLSPASSSQYLVFGDAADNDVGWIAYSHSTDTMRFRVNATDRLEIASDGGIYSSGATGGSQGADTLNVSGVFLDGVSLSGVGAKVWLRMNGTGTPAVVDDFNVSTITDNGTGDYSVNFTTALANANYALLGTANRDGFNQPGLVGPRNTSGTYSTTAIQIAVSDDGGTTIDTSRIGLAIMGS